jgi:hypothetical protein
VGTRLETVARLTRAEYSQHPHVTRGLVAAGVWMHLVDHPVAAIAGHFARAGVLADRPEAGMLAQALNAVPDCCQSAPRAPTRSGLREPASRRVEVVERLVGEVQAPRHGAAESAAGVWNRRFVVGADTVDPGLHLGRIDEPTRGDVGAGLGDPFGFRRIASLPFSFSLSRLGKGSRLGHGANISHGG